MNDFVAEFIGTALLLLIGNGVVANVVLSRTKGFQSGWLAITFGWGLSVFVAVACIEQYTGAHINPAVTLGLAAAGKFAWARVPIFLAAQFVGAFAGSVLAFFLYQAHYHATDDADAKLATFCTGPAIRQPLSNLCSEIMATFVLVFTVLSFVPPSMAHQDSQTPIGLGAVGALPVGLLIVAIGIGLGGTTGFAINPARDFSPRVAHWLLPVPGKRDSDWSYAWVPTLGPVLGGFLAALLYRVTV